MSDLTYTLIAIEDNVHVVRVSGYDVLACVDCTRHAIGSGAFFGVILGVSPWAISRALRQLTNISKHEKLRVKTINQSITLYSRCEIGMACDYLRNNHTIDENTYSTCLEICKRLFQFVGGNVTSNDNQSYDIDELVQRIEQLERNNERLMNIIDRLLEAHPDISIEEMDVIDKDLIDNYVVAVSKNEDETLTVETLNVDDDLTDKEYLFSKEFYVSINDVDNLLTKLHNKDIISDMDEETITVDDTDFFMSAFSYNLSKISDKNKENDIERSYTSISP